MANLRNEFEFRSALLTALGQEHTEAEAKNEEMWRRKMLDGLGVEYNQNDVNQFGLFREKLIEGVTNYSGGGSGGSSDFSTAEVTVINNHSRTAEIRMAFAESEYSDSNFLNYVNTNTTATFIAILYKGTASGNVDIEGGVDYNIEGEGDVETDSSDFYVTGDCTITIS